MLVQGEEDYDLTDDILYDDEKYTLKVVELGGFDINKIGSYEVTYSLTPVTTEETQGNGQDDAQEKQVITFQRTVTVKAAGEETGEFEVPELYLEQGQEDYDLASGLVYDENKYKLDVKDDGNFDIMLSGEYKVTFVLNPLEENPNSENNTGDADASDPDQAEDTFVIPKGITTFTRRVVVTPGIALLSVEGNAINNNYPWGSEMSDTSVTLNVPKDDTYVGTPVLQWTTESTLGKDDIRDDSWDSVPNVTVTDKKIILTGDSLVDGKWYRFKFSDDDYSEAVRIVCADMSNNPAYMYQGRERVKVQFVNKCYKRWYISDDSIAYCNGDFARSYTAEQYKEQIRKNVFDLLFVYKGEWQATSLANMWYTLTESDTTQRNITYSNNKYSPIRFSFKDDQLYMEIEPGDKAFSITSDIALGTVQSIGTYQDDLNFRGTFDRKKVSLILWQSIKKKILSQNRR